MNLTFDEINDAIAFENLVGAYFRELKSSKEVNISNVDVKQSGVGVDGGSDIIVDFILNDEIKLFKRRWVVQCKFHNKNISPSLINTVNIPSLIHSHNANGYLLICKKDPTSGLTGLFERLNNECKFKYHYEFWSGSQFVQKLLVCDNIHKTFFPKYNKFVNSKSNKSK